jgi:hypothetical protein
MDLLKKWSFLSMLIICFSAFSACGKSNAGKSQTNLSVEVKPEQQTEVSKASSKIQSELDKAKKAGKAVFVVVTGTGSSDTDKAKEIAKGANDIYKNAIVVEMNRDDAANSALVTEWRLAGAPLPLILVLSSKGQPAGGLLLAQATAENVAALVPSPKMEAVYDAIGSSKHAIVVFTKSSFVDKTEVLKVAKEAVSKLNNQAVLVEVDMDDIKETGL